MKRATPFLAAVAVFLVYAGWIVSRPEAAPAPDGWGTVAEPLTERLLAFLAGEKVWIGASYALSAGFTVFALSAFRENRKRAAATP